MGLLLYPLFANVYALLKGNGILNEQTSNFPNSFSQSPNTQANLRQ